MSCIGNGSCLRETDDEQTYTNNNCVHNCSPVSCPGIIGGGCGIKVPKWVLDQDPNTCLNCRMNTPVVYVRRHEDAEGAIEGCFIATEDGLVEVECPFCNSKNIHNINGNVAGWRVCDSLVGICGRWLGPSYRLQLIK